MTVGNTATVVTTWVSAVQVTARTSPGQSSTFENVRVKIGALNSNIAVFAKVCMSVYVYMHMCMEYSWQCCHSGSGQ